MQHLWERFYLCLGLCSNTTSSLNMLLFIFTRPTLWVQLGHFHQTYKQTFLMFIIHRTDRMFCGKVFVLFVYQEWAHVLCETTV